MMYSVKRFDSNNLEDSHGARAGILITDWAQNTLRVSDWGHGSVYVEVGGKDVCTNVQSVRALRDYLTEVLTYASEDDGTIGA